MRVHIAGTVVAQRKLGLQILILWLKGKTYMAEAIVVTELVLMLDPAAMALRSLHLRL